MKVFSFLEYPIYLENLRNLFSHIARQEQALYVVTGRDRGSAYSLNCYQEPNEEESPWELRSLNVTLPYKPDVLLLNQCWWGKELDVMAECFQAGIPGVVVEHGAPMASLDRHCYRHSLNGCLFTYLVGERSKRLVEGIGCPSERLVVTGWPRYDDLVHLQAPREEVLTRYTIPPDRKIALFLTTPVLQRDNMLDALRGMEELLAGSTDWKLVLKPHPMEVEKGWVPSAPSAVTVTRDADLHALIAAADVVVTGVSSVLIPAWHFRKPILTYTVPDSESLHTFQAETEGTIRWKRPGTVGWEDIEFSPNLERIRPLLADHAYAIDGHSSERVYRHMRDTVIPLVASRRHDRLLKEMFWIATDLVSERSSHAADRAKLNRVYRELNELKIHSLMPAHRFAWLWLRNVLRKVPGARTLARRWRELCQRRKGVPLS